MFQKRIEEILKEKKITKTEFAQRLGIKKQNVQVAMQTKDITKLYQIADVLDADISDILQNKPTDEITGYLEINGTIHKIRSKDDVLNTLKLL